MKLLLLIRDWKHKNFKFLYYVLNISRQLLPGILYRRRLRKKLDTLKDFDEAYIKKRVHYYNKLSVIKEMQSGTPLSEFKQRHDPKVYFFDAYEHTRYFNLQLRINTLFGDITHVPDKPSITKSRPIQGDHANSVILKLNKVRHFMYTRDKKEFEKKKNMLVGRASVESIHRIKFFEMYFHHPLCEIGQINNGTATDHWLKEKLAIDEQLEYKFILCLEGKDVASNLKWVMSSNSLAVMPKPKFETWFMEGTLIPDYHYVSIKEDYSDLEEKLKYYITNTGEAQKIVKHANEYVKQFKDKKREDLISLLVLDKYFYKTGQIEVKNQTLSD